MENKIQINKVGSSFVISSRCLEITVQCFKHFPWKVTSPIHWRREEVRKNWVNSLCFPWRQSENTVLRFEEVEKKPAGFF